MDALSQKRLADICKMTPAELTAEDIGFLRARRSYLTGQQADYFASVLDGEAPAAPDQPEAGSEPAVEGGSEAPAKPKRGKK